MIPLHITQGWPLAGFRDTSRWALQKLAYTVREQQTPDSARVCSPERMGPWPPLSGEILA